MSRSSRKDKKPPAKPKAIDYNLTPQGVLIKTSNHAEKIGYFDQKLVSYEQQLRSMDSDYAYAIALAKIQVVMDEVALNKRRPISCKSGCSACCHQKVDLGSFEAALIEKHLQKNPIPMDKAHLARQAEALQSGPGAFERLPFDERRCVFLSEDKTCSIYSLRPLMCRRHFVQSDPALCLSEEFHKLEMDVNPDTDAYLSAYVTRNRTTSLPEFIQSLTKS